MNGVYKNGGVREKHGMSNTAEYRTWMAIRERCLNPNNGAYSYYGGRGIWICERWHSFVAFFEDMGTRPSSEHSIDRIDPDGGYEPSNCRWATRLEQQRNTRRTRTTMVNGKKVALSELAEECGLGRDTIQDRLRKGASVSEAMTLPRFTKKLRATPTSSQYQGVVFDCSRDKWIAYVKLSGKMVSFGRFDSEEEAAYVRDSVLLAGINGQPNFTPEVMSALRSRYPDKFTEDKAINRDLEAERKILETPAV